MIDGYIVTNAYHLLPGLKHFARRMLEEFSNLGISVQHIDNSSLLARLDAESKIITPLQEGKFVLYLDKDTIIAHLLEKKGYRLFNSAQAIADCDDKARTYMLLSENEVPIPQTVFGPLNYSYEISESFIKNLENTLPFPLIAKDNHGSLGNNVFLLKTESELSDFELTHRYNGRLYQEFISSSFGVDYRLLVIDGQLVAAMKRVNETGDFRSNIAQGGKGYQTEVPPSYKVLAEKVARLLKLDYCGVDLLIGKNQEPLLCEVNSNAFLEGIEKVSGINIASIYASYIKRKMNL